MALGQGKVEQSASLKLAKTTGLPEAGHRTEHVAMKKLPSKTKPTRRPREAVSARTALPGLRGDDVRFAEVVALIEAARTRAYQAVNTELVALYWQLGEYISRKIANAEWGDGVVDELAASLARRFPGMRGYTRRNLFRMRQFYEAYPVREKVSALLAQLPWTHHLIILGQAKPEEAREFYVLAAIRDRWSSRELERQIRSGASAAQRPCAKESVSSAGTASPWRARRVQKRLQFRIPCAGRRPFRSRPPQCTSSQSWPLPHRARPRLLLRPIEVPGAGRQPGF